MNRQQQMILTALYSDDVNSVQTGIVQYDFYGSHNEDAFTALLGLCKKSFVELLDQLSTSDSALEVRLAPLLTVYKQPGADDTTQAQWSRLLDDIVAKAIQVPNSDSEPQKIVTAIVNFMNQVFSACYPTDEFQKTLFKAYGGLCKALKTKAMSREDSRDDLSVSSGITDTSGGSDSTYSLRSRTAPSTPINVLGRFNPAKGKPIVEASITGTGRVRPSQNTSSPFSPSQPAPQSKATFSSNPMARIRSIADYDDLIGDDREVYLYGGTPVSMGGKLKGKIITPEGVYEYNSKQGRFDCIASFSDLAKEYSAEIAKLRLLFGDGLAENTYLSIKDRLKAEQSFESVQALKKLINPSVKKAVLVQPVQTVVVSPDFRSTLTHLSKLIRESGYAVDVSQSKPLKLLGRRARAQSNTPLVTENESSILSLRRLLRTLMSAVGNTQLSQNDSDILRASIESMGSVEGEGSALKQHWQKITRDYIKETEAHTSQADNSLNITPTLVSLSRQLWVLLPDIIEASAVQSTSLHELKSDVVRSMSGWLDDVDTAEVLAQSSSVEIPEVLKQSSDNSSSENIFFGINEVHLQSSLDVNAFYAGLCLILQKQFPFSEVVERIYGDTGIVNALKSKNVGNFSRLLEGLKAIVSNYLTPFDVKTLNRLDSLSESMLLADSNEAMPPFIAELNRQLLRVVELADPLEVVKFEESLLQGLSKFHTDLEAEAEAEDEAEDEGKEEVDQISAYLSQQAVTLVSDAEDDQSLHITQEFVNQLIQLIHQLESDTDLLNEEGLRSYFTAQCEEPSSTVSQLAQAIERLNMDDRVDVFHDHESSTPETIKADIVQLKKMIPKIPFHIDIHNAQHPDEPITLADATNSAERHRIFWQWTHDSTDHLKSSSETLSDLGESENYQRQWLFSRLQSRLYGAHELIETWASQSVDARNRKTMGQFLDSFKSLSGAVVFEDGLEPLKQAFTQLRLSDEEDFLTQLKNLHVMISDGLGGDLSGAITLKRRLDHSLQQLDVDLKVYEDCLARDQRRVVTKRDFSEGIELLNSVTTDNIERIKAYFNSWMPRIRLFDLAFPNFKSSNLPADFADQCAKLLVSIPRYIELYKERFRGNKYVYCDRALNELSSSAITESLAQALAIVEPTNSVLQTFSESLQREGYSVQSFLSPDILRAVGDIDSAKTLEDQARQVRQLKDLERQSEELTSRLNEVKAQADKDLEVAAEVLKATQRELAQVTLKTEQVESELKLISAEASLMGLEDRDTSRWVQQEALTAAKQNFDEQLERSNSKFTAALDVIDKEKLSIEELLRSSEGNSQQLQLELNEARLQFGMQVEGLKHTHQLEMEDILNEHQQALLLLKKEYVAAQSDAEESIQSLTVQQRELASRLEITEQQLKDQRIEFNKALAARGSLSDQEVESLQQTHDLEVKELKEQAEQLREELDIVTEGKETLAHDYREKELEYSSQVQELEDKHQQQTDLALLQHQESLQLLKEAKAEVELLVVEANKTSERLMLDLSSVTEERELLQVDLSSTKQSLIALQSELQLLQQTSAEEQRQYELDLESLRNQQRELTQSYEQRLVDFQEESALAIDKVSLDRDKKDAQLREALGSSELSAEAVKRLEVKLVEVQKTCDLQIDELRLSHQQDGEEALQRHQQAMHELAESHQLQQVEVEKALLASQQDYNGLVEQLELKQVEIETKQKVFDLAFNKMSEANEGNVADIQELHRKEMVVIRGEIEVLQQELETASVSIQELQEAALLTESQYREELESQRKLFESTLQNQQEYYVLAYGQLANSLKISQTELLEQAQVHQSTIMKLVEGHASEKSSLLDGVHDLEERLAQLSTVMEKRELAFEEDFTGLKRDHNVVVHGLQQELEQFARQLEEVQLQSRLSLEEGALALEGKSSELAAAERAIREVSHQFDLLKIRVEAGNQAADRVTEAVGGVKKSYGLLVSQLASHPNPPAVHVLGSTHEDHHIPMPQLASLRHLSNPINPRVEEWQANLNKQGQEMVQALQGLPTGGVVNMFNSVSSSTLITQRHAVVTASALQGSVSLQASMKLALSSEHVKQPQQVEAACLALAKTSALAFYSQQRAACTDSEGVFNQLQFQACLQKTQHIQAVTTKGGRSGKNARFYAHCLQEALIELGFTKVMLPQKHQHPSSHVNQHIDSVEIDHQAKRVVRLNANHGLEFHDDDTEAESL